MRFVSVLRSAQQFVFSMSERDWLLDEVDKVRDFWGWFGEVMMMMAFSGSTELSPSVRSLPTSVETAGCR